MTATDRAPKARRSRLREMAIRLGGAALLATCGLVSRVLHGLVTLAPTHEATAVELLLAAAAFVSFSCGLALLFQGSGLFELVPVPQRNRYTGF